MNTATSVISVFANRDQAGKAVRKVQSAGMDMNTISILAKGCHNDHQPVGFYTAGDRIKAWGGCGAFWGGLWGMLFGAAFFWVPGFGPLLVAGPFVNTLLGALEGVALVGGNRVRGEGIGTNGALSAALASIGVQKGGASEYEFDLNKDKYLLIASGAPAQVELIRKILEDVNAPGTAAYAVV